ncbi:heme oxygenase [Roseiarcus fermentans]|uniref:Heme oxygenase n=1 Tax=Roseiarcus fermentans TaxID=1473586 RepID=A0A366FPH7_9HYPH|nr:biliverdin-producing heme oxygenase [Roseiarcus fermentans]RBP16457.1 heme oxygenase [Roseiarcus fermentans]
MSEAHAWLKQSTSAAHQKVDAAFSRFALDDARSYRSFLIAQATALFPIEAWLGERAGAVLADWPERARAAALEADLARLEASAPAGAAFAASDDPAAIAGVLYVLEGSRIGGAILAKRVPDRLPKAYLASGCDAQSWRQVVSRLDDVIRDQGTRTASAEAALAVFARFEQAARSGAPAEDRAG